MPLIVLITCLQSNVIFLKIREIQFGEWGNFGSITNDKLQTTNICIYHCFSDIYDIRTSLGQTVSQDKFSTVMQACPCFPNNSLFVINFTELRFVIRNS